ncbi:hypothetical protein ACFPRL_13375 [Pseudoclavibacter helvolus]
MLGRRGTDEPGPHPLRMWMQARTGSERQVAGVRRGFLLRR